LTTADNKKISEFILLWDHLMNGSINAAMKSGRLLADLIAEEQGCLIFLSYFKYP
jgi:hypothetical protein